MLQSVSLPPGVYRNGTELQSKGRYYDADKVRWFEGALRPIGGWRQRITAQPALVGSCRAIWPWKDNNQSRWIALGTSSHLYVMNAAGTVADITPLRKTEALGSDPITTVNGSSDITVADTAHGANVGDTVSLSGATTTGGLTTGQLNAAFIIKSVPTADSWTVTTTGVPATSGATAGGSGVTAKYQIHPGTDDATRALAALNARLAGANSRASVASGVGAYAPQVGAMVSQTNGP